MEILIVEDDKLFAEHLELMLSQLNYKVLGIANSYTKALSLLQLKHVDLVLLDILLSGKKNGIELAEKLVAFQIPFIFMTSFESVEVYNSTQHLPSTNFLVKPIHKYTLDSCIKQTIQNNKKSENFIKLNNHTKSVINIEEIVYISVEHTYSLFHLIHKKEIFKISLTKVLNTLPNHLFVQIHRNTIVNKKYIKEYDLNNHKLITTSNEELSISRRYSKIINEYLMDIK